MATRYLAGAAYVQILPSLRGFQKRTGRELKAIDVRAVAHVVPEVDKQAASKAEDDVQALTDKVTKARAREADAAGRVRVAEQRLQDLRAKGRVSAAQLASAEEALAKATRASEQAQTDAAKATKALEAAQRRHKAAVDDLEKSAERGSAMLARLWQQGEGIDTLSKSLRNARRDALAFSVGAYRAASATVAVGTAVPAVTALGGALATASGAGLVLPGALAGGAVAVAALRVGVVGLGEAFKAAAEGDAEKLAEATANLAPPARALVAEYVRLRPALDELRLDVQARLFAGLSGEVRILAGTYLPAARTGLASMAAEFNTAAREAGGFLRQQQTITDLPLIFDRSRVAVGNLTAGTQPLLSILRDVSAVGSIVVADLTMGFGDATAGLARFVADARATGQLEQWIRDGLAALQDLGTLASQVFGIVNTIFGSAQAQGGGMLGTLILVTGEVRALLQSAEGTAALAAFWSTLRQVVEALLPGVQAVARAVFEGIVALGPQLPGVAAAFTTAAVAVAPLITDLALLGAVILPPLVELFTWLAPALPIIAAGFLAGSVALKGYLLVSNVVRFVQMWAAAQWALNAAMTANPIGIIVVAIGALVGAFIYLWNNSEGFRNFWIGLWEKIQAAAVWVWENALKPAFDGIVTGAKAVGTATSWLWTNVLKPVFDGISLAARVAAAILITVLITPAVLAFKALAAVGLWLWENALSPAFSAIAAAAQWLWSTVLEPVIGFIVAYVRMWGQIFSWLWTNAISPALSAIATAATWLWTTVLQPVIDFVVLAVRGWGQIFGWLWTNAVQPALDGIGRALSWVWENVIRPVFDAIKTAVRAVGDAFSAAVDFIKTAWDRVYEILSKPIKWVIDVIYNDGIRVVWNKVASLVGLGELAPIVFGGTAAGGGGTMRHMAGGGVIPGYAPGVDSVRAMLSPGEAVLVPELVRAIGPETIIAANYAASGRPPGGGYSGGGMVQRFAGGGVVGNLLNWVSGVGDSIVGLWRDPIGWIRSRIDAAGGWADLLARTPAKLITDGASWLWGKIKTFFGFSSDEAASAAGAAGGSPMGWQAMWNIIRAQFPSAILTSAFRQGDPGYHGKGRAIDIAGPMDAINAWIARVYPNSTQLIYTPGVNLLNGRPFRYDAATQADHHDHVHWAFDSGGYLPPGYSTVYNGTGRPEPVLTSEQWDSIGQRGSGGEFTGNLYLDSGEFLGKVRGEIRAANDATATQLSYGKR